MINRYLRLPSIFRGLTGLSAADLPREIFSGFTLAALIIPLNMGYAQIANLSPVLGLYAALLPLLIFALFADSKSLIASPDAPVVALIPTLLLFSLGMDGSLIALTLNCAFIFFLLWFFRLGFLFNFLSQPLLIGFISGLGIKIFLHQLYRIMSVPHDAHSPIDSSLINMIFPDSDSWLRNAHNFVLLVNKIIVQFPLSNWYSMLIGIGTILIIRLGKRYTPRLPGALIAIILMMLIVKAFNLEDYGVQILGFLKAGLPSFKLPPTQFDEYAQLFPSALIICAVTLSEGLLLTKRYSQLYGDKVDINQEIFAFGASNIAAGLTGALVMGSSASRTATMVSVGARSQIPSIVASLSIGIVLVFYSDVISMLPMAALAGVVANSVLSLVEVDKLRDLQRKHSADFWLAIIALLSVLFIGVFKAVIITFVLSAVMVVMRASRPLAGVVNKDSENQFFLANEKSQPIITMPGILIYRFEFALLFFNATAFADGIHDAITRTLQKKETHIRLFILDATGIVDLDTTGASALEDTVKFIKNNGIQIAITHASSNLISLLHRYDLTGVISKEQIFTTNTQAIAKMT